MINMDDFNIDVIRNEAGNIICERCNEFEAEPLHICPYDYELNEPPYGECTCCIACCIACADDI